MHATPDEMLPLHTPFEVVLRGFNRQQVLDHLESLEGRIEIITADRDAALQQAADLSKLLDHLRREVEEATGRVERLQRSSLGGAGLRIQRMLQVAEDEITALQVSTEQETTSLRERARTETDRLLRETTQRCERLEAESERRRKTAETESATRCRQAEQESERHRRSAEQQSERDIARQESEARDRIREYQTRGMAGLHLLMRMAGERLNNRLSAIERETTRLTQLRAEVTAQLTTAHGALVEAVGRVRQAPVLERDGWPDGSPRPAPTAAVGARPPAVEGVPAREAQPAREGRLQAVDPLSA
jgi:cell division septum initiation protein DivIVA